MSSLPVIVLFFMLLGKYAPLIIHVEFSKVILFKLAPIVAANITVTVLAKDVIVKDEMVRLSSLQEKEFAKIVGISKECRGDNRRRLLDLGFVKGTEISIDLLSPLQNPKAYLVKGTSIALRNEQASKILIQKV